MINHTLHSHSFFCINGFCINKDGIYLKGTHQIGKMCSMEVSWNVEKIYPFQLTKRFYVLQLPTPFRANLFQWCQTFNVQGFQFNTPIYVEEFKAYKIWKICQFLQYWTTFQIQSYRAWWEDLNLHQLNVIWKVNNFKPGTNKLRYTYVGNGCVVQSEIS